VPGDVLDVVLLLAALLFAVSGYRQGFVVGVLSFVGFLGGGVLGRAPPRGMAESAFLADLPHRWSGSASCFLPRPWASCSPRSSGAPSATG
jgi:hypothetical protein